MAPRRPFRWRRFLSAVRAVRLAARPSELTPGRRSPRHAVTALTSQQEFRALVFSIKKQVQRQVPRSRRSPSFILPCSETCAICISNSSSRASQTLDIRPPQLNTSGYSASSEGGHDHELPSRAQCRSARPCAILGCVFKDLNCSGLLRNLEETLGPSTPRAVLPGSAAWGCGRRAHRGSVLAPEQQRGDRRGADARSTSFRPITCQRAESEAGRATLRAL